MSAWVGFGIYLVTATLIAASAIRWLALHVSSKTHCHITYGSCNHHVMLGCPTAGNEVGGYELCRGVAIGFLWPLTLLPAVAYFIATFKPRPVVDYDRIERLERELGITT